MISNQLFKPQIPQKKCINKNDKKICCLCPYRLNICYDFIRKMPIPLQGVHQFLKVQQGFFIVELQQTYSTFGYQEPIELEYLFSINQNAAVTKMVVELGDKKVYGIIKEKEEAKQEYEEGVKQGKTMAYSEQDEEFPEIKRVKIGALAPQKELKITFEYIQPLEVFLNKFWKVEVYPMIDENYFNLQQQQQVRLQSVYFQSLNRYIQKYVYLEKFEYNFKQNITASIDIGSPITYYKSPTHSILSGNAKIESAKQSMEEEHPRKLILMLEDTPSNFIPTKQFTLLFTSDEINLPRAVLSHTNNDALFTQKYCATISFIPKFNQTTLDDAYSQYLDGLNIAQNQVINRGNYLFFIDRSGSMTGARINKAKQSLLLFLKSLPEDCNFNIISFGSTFRSLWSESKQYSQNTLEDAIKHVNNMEANMNGTEILKPLSQVVYSKYYGKSKSTTLNVFLLTDGEVEAQPIIDLVKKNNQAETRVYTLGIGEGCSQFLIKRLAEVGNGKFQFVSDNEDINAKVIDLLEDSLTPYLKEFNLETNVTNIAQIIPNPESVVCLKKNQELTIQVLFSIDQYIDNLQFTLSCFDPQDQKPIKYEVSLNLNTSQENEYFHKLATHKFITFYENSLNYGENDLNFIKINKQTIDDQDIINTSITHQILSNKTAFVCEVCELEDNFKQQKSQKVYITYNKKENIVYQKKMKCLSSRATALSSMDRSRPMTNCFKKQSCVQELQFRQYQIGISHVGGSNSEEEDECEEQIKCIKEEKKKKCQKKEQGNKKSENCRDMIEEDSIASKKEKSRSREKLNKSRGSFHQEDDLPKAQIPPQTYKIEYEQIISYAKADGAFEYDLMFEQKINFQGWINEQNYPQNIWFTLLALLYLDYFCSQNRKSWQLVYQKGIQFLQKNGVNYKQTKEGYLQKQLIQI